MQGIKFALFPYLYTALSRDFGWKNMTNVMFPGAFFIARHFFWRLVLENHEERVIYYAMKIKKALLLKKSYMVVNFSQLAIQVFEAIVTNQDTWDYKGWSFMAFFHDDEDNGAGEHTPPDVKREILIGMYHNSFMMEYTIPRGYTLTEQDIKDIKEWWDWPNKETTIEELFNYSRKLPFPFYDIIKAYKKLNKGEEKSDTGTRQHHSRKAKNGNF